MAYSTQTKTRQKRPGSGATAQQRAAPSWMHPSLTRLESDLVAKFGASQRERARRGLRQASQFWRAEDGDREAFEQFVVTNFAGDQAALDTMFSRFEYLLEKLHGHMHEMRRELRQQVDLDTGPIQSYDEVFAGYDPSAHVVEDFFRNKIAFVVLLNFPLTTLQQRMDDGRNWTRRQWAEARLAQQFSKRLPADVNLAIAKAAAESERYIAEYNIWMHHLVDEKGDRPFPPKLRLLSHWNLRDEIKANYAKGRAGLRKQRTIQQVMERIVTQTIPAAVINNPSVDWNPFTNEVRAAAVKDSDAPAPDGKKPSSSPEGTRRYEKLLGAYLAARKADPYSPAAPTLIARRFDEEREIPEQRVKAMLEQVLLSPAVPRVAGLIVARLGRALEPFDIWYNGFRPDTGISEIDLDRIVAERYPTAEAYRRDIPRLLETLGFPRARAEYIASNIMVDPARGSGHAYGPAMRSAKTHLRTRVEKGGMNYKGYNTAVHEMGHNVEQILSMNEIDHYLLNGVPNTAFTEALAFVFQGRDLELLGFALADPKSEALKTLNDFWGTYEISGVALVDMAVWHWMYEHPAATPAELKKASIKISEGIWNKYFSSVFKRRDVLLLGIYSHMIHSFLYLPDYPIGRIIAHQIEEQMKKSGAIGPQFELMVKSGSIAPDLWMRHATGSPVGPEALLAATERALEEMGVAVR